MLRPLLLLGILTALLGVACTGSPQVADLDYRPSVEHPTWPPASGPLVAIDEGHHNFHTAAGRYRPFADLLRADGYRVRTVAERFDAASLDEIDVLVVANALAREDLRRWRLPNRSALEPPEIESVAAWVRGGGSLLLIADHMPFPGATEELAKAFGVLFANGFAFGEGQQGTLLFSRRGGGLVDHPITRGRSSGESIDVVATFTGQAFRSEVELEPLLVLPRDSSLLLPVEAWEFSEETPRISASGLLQGAVARVGDGRLAVFGEAAMFTAQISTSGRPMGLNAPEASGNARFTLNLMHWLSGLLPETHSEPDDSASSAAESP